MKRSLYQMMGEQQNEVRVVFTEALALTAADDRARYLDAACRDKPGLRHRVETLLRAREQAGEFLTQDALGGNLDCGESSVTEKPGTVIGHYKLLEQIGEGGFGVVFMAEQIEPIRRRVALKIVKPGMDTKQVIARFEAERQALAMMDHPNIAKIFDAGVTGDSSLESSSSGRESAPSLRKGNESRLTSAATLHYGRPYFVMELVHGVPLTDFCDANNLTAHERLKLFLTVCEAVQHAHQKGIIHRDLKPSNILVTLHDGRPVPKVIDFGTAKALQHPLTEKTLFTAYGKLIGTPQYMSPEQAEMSGLDVDTRADIYSLGVLLYELLTGTTPFEAERLRAAAFEEMMRIIRQEEPPKPSTRVSTLGERATEISKHRQVDAALLRRSLQGDLDWIVMKALEKDRARRYDCAGDLINDIQHHLNHEPVKASPPGAPYRARKFIRRHRMGVALAGSVTAVLIAGLVVSLLAFAKARRERDYAMAAEAEAGRQQIRAEQKALESHERLVRQYVAAGNEHVEEGNFFGALPWFALALKEEQNDPFRAGLHRLRLGSTFQPCPKLIAVCGGGNSLRIAEFSPDGRRFVTGSMDGAARVWDTSTGEPVTPLLLHSNRIRAARFSPDGRWVVTASVDGTAQVWDAQTGQRRTAALKHAGPVHVATFSPDGLAVLTGSEDQTAQLWDALTGEPLGAPLKHNGLVVHAEFSPDGRSIATSSRGEGLVYLWNMTTRPSARRLQGGSNPCAFSRDGNYLITARYSESMVFDRQSGKLIALADFKSTVRVVLFSPDGHQAVATTDDGLAHLWNPITSGLGPALRHNGGMVASAAFSPDGLMVATGGEDQTARIWDATTGEMLFPPLTHPHSVRRVSFSPDGRCVLTACDDGCARLWDLAGGRLTIPPVRHSDVVYKAAFHPDGRRVATVATDDTAVLWDLATGTAIHSPLAQIAQVRHIAFSPDGEWMASAHTNGVAQVCNLVTGKAACPPLQHQGPVNHIEFSPDGQQVVTASDDGLVRIWAVASGKLLSRMRHAGAVSYCTFTPDAKQVVTATVNTQEQMLLIGVEDLYSYAGSVANSSRVQRWDSATGELAGPSLVFDWQVSQAAFSPDRGLVITSCSNEDIPGRPVQVWVWDTVTGKQVTPALSHPGSVVHASFSLDGRRVVTADPDNIRIWDLATTKGVIFPLTPRGIEHATFSPDGRLLVSAGGTSARVWDAATGVAVTPPLKALSGAGAVRAWFSPDSQYVVVATADGCAQAWPLYRRARPVEDEMHLAQLLAGHGASEQETRTELPAGWVPATWSDLKARYPADFTLSPEQLAAWGQRQKQACAKVAAEYATKARCLVEENDLAEAEAAIRKALSMQTNVFGSAHRAVDDSLVTLARVLEAQGKLSEAEVAWRQELATERALSGDGHPFVANSLAKLTSILLRQEKFAEAEPLARECLAIREKNIPDDWLTFNTRSLMAGSMLGQRKYAEVESLLLSGYESMKQRVDKIPDVGKPLLKETLQRLVQLYEATGRPAQAAEWNQKLTDFEKAEAENKSAAPPH